MPCSLRVARLNNHNGGLLVACCCFHTFAIDFEVDNDRLHGTLAVPPEALSCPPAHFPHEQLPHTSRHRSRPKELILTKTMGQKNTKISFQNHHHYIRAILTDSNYDRENLL